MNEDSRIPKLIVVDDDLSIVDEFKCLMSAEYPRAEVVGPPRISFEVSSICQALPRASALILDLNLGGTAERGIWLLDKLSGHLGKNAVTVVLWSKYIYATRILLGGAFYDRSGHQGEPASADQMYFRRARNLYSGVRGFVSKLVEDPASELAMALRYLSLIPPEAIKEEDHG